jgi:hypothetical protein
MIRTQLPPKIELRFSDRPARSLFIILLCSGIVGRKSVLHNQTFFSKGLCLLPSHILNLPQTALENFLSLLTGFPQRMEMLQNVLKYVHINHVRSRISLVSCSCRFLVLSTDLSAFHFMFCGELHKQEYM